MARTIAALLACGHHPSDIHCVACSRAGPIHVWQSVDHPGSLQAHADTIHATTPALSHVATSRVVCPAPLRRPFLLPLLPPALHRAAVMPQEAEGAPLPAAAMVHPPTLQQREKLEEAPQETALLHLLLAQRKMKQV
eukprot:gene2177-biopygen1799